jgi:tRNA (guanine37-N1)-methyltransferase
MQFDILTIFPNLLESPLQEGIIRRARNSELIKILVHDIRKYAVDKHTMTDDRPFGGGEGMIMKPEPIANTLESIDPEKKGKVIFLTPQGKSYTQEMASELAEEERIILLCGRYEGIDERIRANYVDREISIGDYILTGGELGAMVLVDSITRLLPGVLGCSESVSQDTFTRGSLKYPQYTRPRNFEGHSVPDVLLSGNHKDIYEWRLVSSINRTIKRRPDLLAEVNLSESDKKILIKNGVNLT